ncbi:MAG: ATP-binding cassette domain-containing protein [Leptolyngbyaceae cyanobacterium SM2_5_2]|nr:ATP-binding cassette domain-containing protein [Leptolyngbyaceae cyanobacterium SM2_5_2]
MVWRPELAGGYRDGGRNSGLYPIPLHHPGAPGDAGGDCPPVDRRRSLGPADVCSAGCHPSGARAPAACPASTQRGVRGRIVFDTVSFAYPNRDGRTGVPVLRNLSLTIEPGQTVAFLGATGSGKSTLVNLIPRFYDVTAGQLTIDGVDVRQIPLATLHQLWG